MALAANARGPVERWLTRHVQAAQWQRMNIAGKLRYAFRASRKSSSIAVSPLAGSLFFLVPQRVSTWLQSACHYRYRNLEFFARQIDWGPVDQVLLGREYGFAESLLQGCPQPRIVDLGANIGAFALAMFDMNPSATIYSVEASPKVFEMLQRNRRANPGLDWHIFHFAMWISTGQVRFQPGKDSGAVDTVSQDGPEILNSISLQQFLDDHVPGNIDLLKMDIDGAEEGVLSSSGETLKRVEQMVLQIHPGVVDVERVYCLLQEEFNFLYRVPDTVPPNPLIVATRKPQGPPLEGFWAR